MLTLKRLLLPYAENEDKYLFIHFNLDTEELGFLSGWDRLFTEQVFIKKPWTGKVDTINKEFKVARTRTRHQIAGPSSFEVLGKIINDETIELKIRPTWPATASIVIVTICLTSMVANLFNDIFGWTLLFCLLTLQTLVLILDFRKTESAIVSYIERSRQTQDLKK